MKIKQKCRCHTDPVNPPTCEGHLTVKWPFWVESGSARIRFYGRDGSERHQTITPGRVVIEVPVEISR